MSVDVGVYQCRKLNAGCWMASSSHCWFKHRAAAVNVLTLHVVLTCNLPRSPFSQVWGSRARSASIKTCPIPISVSISLPCTLRPIARANKEAPDPWRTFPGTYEPNGTFSRRSSDLCENFVHWTNVNKMAYEGGPATENYVFHGRTRRDFKGKNLS